jgi:hypothetical protein
MVREMNLCKDFGHKRAKQATMTFKLTKYKIAYKIRPNQKSQVENDNNPDVSMLNVRMLCQNVQTLSMWREATSEGNAKYSTGCILTSCVWACRLPGTSAKQVQARKALEQ